MKVNLHSVNDHFGDGAGSNATVSQTKRWHGINLFRLFFSRQGILSSCVVSMERDVKCKAIIVPPTFSGKESSFHYFKLLTREERWAEILFQGNISLLEKRDFFSTRQLAQRTHWNLANTPDNIFDESCKHLIVALFPFFLFAFILFVFFLFNKFEHSFPTTDKYKLLV